MHTIHLTAGELEYLRNRMQLTAMNETGRDAELASSIAIQIDDALAEQSHRVARTFVQQFADLFPAGGRE
jgi:hypothetical protein